ncbi:ATP binding protein [Ditylenchus destructor]|uniref:GPN-loop GTPase n=1 Tax=Ditylenchus destructor TaxID=166010 RepID=A0AAD4NFT3_9BILA|nr:ATP binding protein [Ditylenchus destructor]
MDLLEKRKTTAPYFLIDTPGQIEAFTWSASGTIITDTLASTYPTMIAYVVDSARATNPTTFMSNMLYACSILYRTKLPFFLVFNKADIVKPDFATKWMGDFEAFQDALDETKSSYMNDLTRSLSLVLDTFYENLNHVAVSSRTGEGFDKVLETIEKCTTEYDTVYKPMYDQLLKERSEAQGNEAAEELNNLEIKDKGTEKKDGPQ